MTIDEISIRYNIDVNKLRFFEQNELIADLSNDQNLKQLAFLCTLYNSGLDIKEIKRFISFYRDKNQAEQIKLLSTKRQNLLDEIHKKQKSIDDLDYIIYEIKNKIQFTF